METTWIFRSSKLHRKRTWKQRGVFDQRNYIEKARENDVVRCGKMFLPHSYLTFSLILSKTELFLNFKKIFSQSAFAFFS